MVCARILRAVSSDRKPETVNLLDSLSPLSGSMGSDQANMLKLGDIQLIYPLKRGQVRFWPVLRLMIVKKHYGPSSSHRISRCLVPFDESRPAWRGHFFR